MLAVRYNADQPCSYILIIVLAPVIVSFTKSAHIQIFSHLYTFLIASAFTALHP